MQVAGVSVGGRVWRRAGAGLADGVSDVHQRGRLRLTRRWIDSNSINSYEGLKTDFDVDLNY